MHAAVGVTPSATAFFFSLRVSGLTAMPKPVPSETKSVSPMNSHRPSPVSTPPTLNGCLPSFATWPSPTRASVLPVHHGALWSHVFTVVSNALATSMRSATLPSASVSLPPTTAPSNTSYAAAAPRSGHVVPVSVPYISDAPTGIFAACSAVTTTRVTPVSESAGWIWMLKSVQPGKSTWEDLQSVLVNWWKLIYHWS